MPPPQQRDLRQFHPPLLELAAGLSLLVAALVVTLTSGAVSASTLTGPIDPRPVTVGVVPVPSPNPSPNPAALPAVATETTSTTVQPERILIPRLGVDAPVVPTDTSRGGSLVLPPNPHVLGWWAHGAQPGAEQGTAIIAGHVNTVMSGPGALFYLSELQPGDDIIVLGSGRALQFRVVTLHQYRKSQLPASTAFSQEVDGRLAIVSCGGPLDARTGRYRDNIIAYAVPV